MKVKSNIGKQSKILNSTLRWTNISEIYSENSLVCQKVAENIDDLFLNDSISPEEASLILMTISALSRDNRINNPENKGELLKLHWRLINLIQEYNINLQDLQSLDSIIWDNVILRVKRSEMETACEDLWFDFNLFHKKMTEFYDNSDTMN